MEQWQNISNGLFSAETPSIASLSGIVDTLVQTYGAEPVELLSFDNIFVWSNKEVTPGAEPLPWATFVTEWETGFAWDVKGAWNWGLGEYQLPQTGEYVRQFNPNIQLFAYFNTWFMMTFEFFYFSIDFDFTPFDIKPLSIDLHQSDSLLSLCAGISATSEPVVLQVNTNWGWPNCSWGFFQHYVGWRVQPEVEGAQNGCEMVYFGSDFGNDTPAWTRTFFEFYDWQLDFLPKVCFGGSSAPQGDAEVTEENSAVDEETAPAAL